jgi:hypothetical protein
MPEQIFTEFVEFQSRLFRALVSAQPEARSNKWLLGVKRQVDLNLGDEVWSAVRHGVGFRYTRKSPLPSLVVDAHDNIESTRRIDAFRLQEFAESKGISISFEQAKNWLEKAVNAGLLSRLNDNGYLLK